MLDKQALSERDICTKFITPALKSAGWDEMTQIREEVSFTKGRIIVRGKLVARGKGKRADYVLYYKPNIPLALIEAKDNTQAMGRVCSRRWNMPKRSTWVRRPQAGTPGAPVDCRERGHRRAWGLGPAHARCRYGKHCHP